VTVTAARVATPVTEVPASLRVLDREELASGPVLPLDVVLSRVAGFSLFRDQSSLVAHPTTQGASLRGIGPSGAGRALVLMDGLPLGDPFGGWVYWGKVPTVGIERIEVLRGGGSSLWGSGALGGVVQVLRTRPTHDLERLELSLADPTSQTVEALVARRRGRHGLVVEGRFFNTDGYPLVRARDRGAIDRRARSRDAVVGLRYELDLSRRTRADFGAHVFHEERASGTPLSANATRSAMLRAGLDHEFVSGDRIAVRLFSGWQNFQSTFSSQADDRASETPALDQFDVPSFEGGAALVWDRATGERGWWTAGADLRVVRGETNEHFFFSEGRLQRGRRAGGREVLAGLWAEEAFDWTPALRTTLALRGDFWRFEDGESATYDLAPGSDASASSLQSGDEVLLSPKLGLLWTAAPGVSLRSAVYRGLRAPTLNELVRPFRVRNDITAANAGLRAETVWGGEVGVDLGSAGRRVSATAFWNEIEDPVFNVTVGEGPGTVDPCGFVPAGGVCRQRRNLGRARVRGIEADGDFRLGREWLATLGWLWSDTEVRSAATAPELLGRRLPQVPRHTILARLAWERGPATVAAGLRWSADRYEDDRNTLLLGDYAVADLAIGWGLGAGWRVVLAAENVLDREFEVSRTADDVVGIGAPRFVHLGLRYDSDAEAAGGLRAD
jgi:outer membrane receptor protein involved in Fe transport